MYLVLVGYLQLLGALSSVGNSRGDTTRTRTFTSLDSESTTVGNAGASTLVIVYNKSPPPMVLHLLQ